MFRIIEVILYNYVSTVVSPPKEKIINLIRLTIYWQECGQHISN